MRKRSIKIAITGRIGSGKSTVGRYLAEKGYVVFDCDKISRIIADEKDTLSEIVTVFGREYVENGKLNRVLLRKNVFGNTQKELELNRIFHDRIREHLIKNMQESQEKIIFAEVPLLFECGFMADFDYIWIIKANEESRLNRVITRDNVEIENARKINSSQLAYYPENENCFVIDNNGDTYDLHREIDKLLILMKELVVK